MTSPLLLLSSGPSGPAPLDYTPPPGTAPTFFTLEILGGTVGFPVLLLFLAITRKASRHPVFLNFCITWIPSSVAFCLLLYTGYYVGPQPPFGLCLTQASLVYGFTIMSASWLWALVFHLWLSIRGSVKGSRITPARLALLLCVPYVAACAFILGTVTVGYANPHLVYRKRARFVCSIDIPVIPTVVESTSTFIAFVTLIFEGLIAVNLFRSRHSLRTIRVQGWSSVHLFVRIALFTVYVILCAAVSVLAIFDPTNIVPIMIQSSLPTVAFLVFGTSRDLYRRSGLTTVTTATGTGTVPRLSNRETDSGAEDGATRYKADALQMYASPRRNEHPLHDRVEPSRPSNHQRYALPQGYPEPVHWPPHGGADDVQKVPRGDEWPPHRTEEPRMSVGRQSSHSEETEFTPNSYRSDDWPPYGLVGYAR